MKRENQVLATTAIDRRGERIPERELVSMYEKFAVPMPLHYGHDTIKPPVGRLVSKSLAVGIYGQAVIDGRLADSEKHPGIPSILFIKSGGVPQEQALSHDDIIGIYQRMGTPAVPDVNCTVVIGGQTHAVAKILAIVGDIEVFDERNLKGMKGLSIGFFQGARVRPLPCPGSDGKKNAEGKRVARVVIPLEVDMTVSANPILFDEQQIEQVLAFSRPGFLIAVKPKHEKAWNEFPWIIVFSFFAAQYLTGFLGELGRGHASKIGSWFRRLLDSHQAKADEEIRAQFITPLEGEGVSLRLSIAVGAGKISEFSRAYDERKIVEEIERQTSRKIADLKEVSVSYLGGRVYRLEYAITCSGDLIKPPETEAEKRDECNRAG